MRRVADLLCAAVAVLWPRAGCRRRTAPCPSTISGRAWWASGRTVFEGDRLDEFKVHILGVLRNVIGPSRNLILARLEGGPLANTGVIAGMSGSPVYIDGRLVGAVSYSLGQFSKEPIAGITPIDEMVEAATLPGAAAPGRARRSADAAHAGGAARRRCARRSPGCGRSPTARPTCRCSTRRRRWRRASAPCCGPIATPITLAGFDAAVADPVTSAFRDRGFLPVLAGGAQRRQAGRRSSAPLRPGDPIGVALMSGDLELGATGTVTDVVGDRVYAFGHPFYSLGPTAFPMTRAHVHRGAAEPDELDRRSPAPATSSARCSRIARRPSPARSARARR